MNIRLTTGFVLAMLACHAQASCPLRKERTQLQEAARNDPKFIGAYAISRLVACGFAQARADLELALPLPGTDMLAFGQRDADDIASRTTSALIFDVLSQRPREFVADYAREQHMQSDAIRSTPASQADAAARLEQAIPALVDMLRERLSAERITRLDTYFERVLVAHEVRTGLLEQALARIERFGSDPRWGDAPRSGFYATPPTWAARTREVLALTSPVTPPMSDWVIDRTGSVYRESCQPWTIADACALQHVGLLADVLLGRGDQAGAIEVLLRNEWAGTTHAVISCDRQLVQLLGERYSPEALRSGWIAAEQSVRIAGADSGFLLYGVELPLPRAVRETDPADPSRTIERPLRRDEAIAYLRDWNLFAALFPDGLPPR